MKKRKDTHAWLIVPTVLLAVVAAGDAVAQCPGASPQLATEIDPQPQILNLCSHVTSTGGCIKAPTPTADGLRAQEAVLHATDPAGFTATSAEWAAYEVNAAGTLDLLWHHISKDGQPWSGGQKVKFGAAGLPESSNVKFRMSFCDDTECFCWSDYSTVYQTTAFSGTAPDPIAAGAREVEEVFERPETSYSGVGTADGVGPDDVWSSYNAKVADDLDSSTEGGSVHLQVDGVMRRVDDLEHEHAYAEAWIRNDLGWVGGAEDALPEEYNVDVSVRSIAQGLKAYYVKLVHESGYGTGDGKPTLVLGRAVSMIRSEFSADRLTLTDSTSNTQTKCPLTESAYPMETEDPGKQGRTKPALLRIEVDDDGPAAVLTGYLAWGCTSGAIEDCTYVCKVGPLLDPGADDAGLSNVKGAAGVSSHHKTYFVDSFKAGSTSE